MPCFFRPYLFQSDPIRPQSPKLVFTLSSRTFTMTTKSMAKIPHFTSSNSLRCISTAASIACSVVSSSLDYCNLYFTAPQEKLTEAATSTELTG